MANSSLLGSPTDTQTLKTCPNPNLWFSPSTSKTSWWKFHSSRYSGQKPWNCLSLLLFLAPTYVPSVSKFHQFYLQNMQNPAVSHHLPCYHSGPSHHLLLRCCSGRLIGLPVSALYPIVRGILFKQKSDHIAPRFRPVAPTSSSRNPFQAHKFSPDPAHAPSCLASCHSP